MKWVFTTMQAAEIMMLSRSTVCRQFDRGCLKGYRIPGTPDRRIPREYLIRYMQENGIPLGKLEHHTGKPKILVVSRRALFVAGLNARFKNAFAVEVAESGFDAGVKTVDLGADALVVDFAIGCEAATKVVEAVSKFDEVVLTTVHYNGSDPFFRTHSKTRASFGRPHCVTSLVTHVNNVFFSA